ncbi:hypothetical protein D3C80_1889250 [compost metagenome]
MIDDDPARLGLGVGIAFAAQARHDATFGGENVGGASGIAWRQVHVLGHDLLGHGVGNGSDPVDPGFVQHEAAARHDGDDSDGFSLAFNIILKRRLVIAFRA